MILINLYILNKNTIFLLVLIPLIISLIYTKKIVAIIIFLFATAFLFIRIQTIGEITNFISNNTNNIKVSGRIISIENKNFSKNLILWDAKINGVNVGKIKAQINNKVDIKFFQKITANANIIKLNYTTIDGNYNEKLDLFSRNIFAKVKIISKPIIRESKITDLVNMIYSYIDRKINIKNKDVATTIKALFLGSSKIEASNIKDYFNLLGVSHLFAISGMHFLIFSKLFDKILKKIIFNGIIRYIIITTILFIYLILCSITISAFRAFIMTIILFFSYLIKRSYDSLTALSITLIITITICPYAIYSVAFILSYSMVIIIGIISEFDINKFDKTIAIYISTLPILSWCFYEIPLYVVLATTIFLPIIIVVIYATSLSLIINIIFIKMANIILFFSATLMNLLIYLSFILSKLPYTKIITGRPNILLIIFSYLLVFLFLILKTKIRYLIIIFIFLLLTYKFKGNEIYFITVNNNPIHIVKLDNLRVILVTKKITDDEINYKIKPFLKFHNINDIDTIISRKTNRRYIIKKSNIRVSDEDIHIKTPNNECFISKDFKIVLNRRTITKDRKSYE